MDDPAGAIEELTQRFGVDMRRGITELSRLGYDATLFRRMLGDHGPGEAGPPHGRAGVRADARRPGAGRGGPPPRARPGAVLRPVAAPATRAARHERRDVGA